MLSVPVVPTVVLGVKVLAVLSTSTLVKVPLVVNGALVSVRTTLALLTVAASLVPLMVILIVEVVPSTLATVKVSFTFWPTFKLSNALLAV